jgi:hypothetical protein
MVYTASALIRNSLSGGDLDGLLGQIYAFTRASGLGRGAEFLWDLVPFSFVVNWFARVDKWLRNNVDVGGYLNILRFEDGGVSFKRTFSSIVTIEGGGLSAPEIAGYVYLTDYQRQLGLAIDGSIATLKGSLTPSQWAVLTALFGQRA